MFLPFDMDYNKYLCHANEPPKTDAQETFISEQILQLKHNQKTYENESRNFMAKTVSQSVRRYTSPSIDIHTRTTKTKMHYHV